MNHKRNHRMNHRRNQKINNKRNHRINNGTNNGIHGGVGRMVWMVVISAVVCFLGILWRDSTRFVRVDYKIRSSKIKKRCRIVMLSDLHDKEYGKENCRLIEAIDQAAPDLILIAGDMLTANDRKTDDRVALHLVRKLAEKYPVYYGMGNHEYRLKIYRYSCDNKYLHYEQGLREAGVHLLQNATAVLKEYGIEICGLEMARAFYKRWKHTEMPEQYLNEVLGEAKGEAFHLLIAHNPDYMKRYAEWGADLVLSGHVHGGVVRIPGLGGLISPMMHLFPYYDGGLYEEGNCRMILGRGLGMHTIPLRLFNPGELVVITLDPEEA